MSDNTGQPMNVTNVIVNAQPTKSSNDLMVTGLHGERPWSAPLFGCMDDIVNAILTFFFLPCMECRVASRAGECLCVPYCVCGGSLAVRTKIRAIGGIQGSILNDSLLLQCCGPCAVCQMSRELDLMGLP